MVSALELSEAEIQALLEEQKQLPRSFAKLFDLRPRRAHSEAQIDISCESGHIFHVRLRQSRLYALDFSAIFAYYLPTSGKLFRLRRYNGRAHEHSNTIERERFLDFHIHMATERYQLIGVDEDRYAERTDRYTNLRQAFDCLRSDCSLHLPAEGGQPL